MATVAEVMDDAARECSVTKPNAWTAATSATHLELRMYLRQTVDELLERVDWPDPISADADLSGADVEEYNLPDDFKRLTRDPLTVYETTTTRRAGIPVPSRGAWTHLQDIGSGDGNRYYRVAGDEESGFTISFFPVPATGAALTVSYVSKNWLAASAVPGFTWSNETDTLLLPRRLIEAGVVWRYRRRKGLPYLDRYNEYEAMLARQANDKRGVRSISFGEREETLPMRVPVPDYIPSA